MNDIVVMKDAAYAVYKTASDSQTAVFCDVDVDFFKKYLTALEKDGLTKYSEADFSTGDKINLFATYEAESYIVDIDFHSGMQRMYATYTPKKEGWVLPCLQKPDYTPCSLPTIVTQVGTERFHPDAVSMCYIVRAADGSFVIIDSDFGEGMAELIYDVLKKQAPDPDNIVIAAWIFTHPHLDHVGGFMDFADKYANDKTITLKQIVYNFPNDAYVGDFVKNLINGTNEAADKFKDATLIKAHAGNILYYANLTFRVLYTQEQYTYITEGRIEDANATSVVTQMQTDDGVTVLFGGDHCVKGSYGGLPFCEGALYEWYGDFIKSDVVTLFHHGFGGGADLEVYNYIKPSVVLWPATMFRLYHNSDGTPYTPIITHPRNQYFVNPEEAEKNGVLGYYIAADCIHIVDLTNKDLKVTEYEHCDKYLKNTEL